MPAGLRSTVEAIAGTPLPHGILGASCTTLYDVTEEQIHELNGVQWLGLGCCPARDWADPCETPPGETPPPPPDKEFCRPEVEHAAPITVYAGAECSALGFSYDEAREQALASLALGEQHAVEAGFMRTKLSMEAVDLTPPGGPLSIAQGVAVLEGCLAESYGGVGTLHVPAGAAALLGCCNLLREDPQTGSLRTLAGNCAVIGAGYSYLNTGPAGTPADPGTAWLYITGPLVIRRGPVDVVPDRSRASASVNPRNNDRRVLAERTYLVGTTCKVCAVLVETCP
ncbi:cupin [Streptomyces sp. NPDC005395]|uniref:cupin n=1 Tax=Streptomyces sp. NPDC005395 TaxID=3157042 RepID=UPI0033B06F1D